MQKRAAALTVYADFDQTIVLNHSALELHKSAFFAHLKKHHIKVLFSLARDVIIFFRDEILKEKDGKVLRDAAKYLQGIYMPDIMKKLKPKIQVNPKIKSALMELCRRQNIDYNEVKQFNLTIVSRSDYDLIKALLLFIEEELKEKYKIKINRIIANKYEKYHNFYTGKLHITVEDKHQFFKNDYFIGDGVDALKYKKYPDFIEV